jgi:hypothetical protein
MIDIADIFKMACEDIRSDINEHLPTLLKYGRLVDHITEFGVRGGCSTVAWWYAHPKTLRCYDIARCNAHDVLMSEAEGAAGFDYRFIQADVLGIEIEETDLLFIDTYHTYIQLSRELDLHANKVRKYLIFHDTVTFGLRGEDHRTPGIVAAIDEFMLWNPHWVIKEVFTNNNGLFVLKRI